MRTKAVHSFVEGNTDGRTSNVLPEVILRRRDYLCNKTPRWYWGEVNTNGVRFTEMLPLINRYYFHQPKVFYF